MSHLYQRLGAQVDAWRAEGYPSAEYPTLSEILDWALESESGVLRFLRRPQLRALETYWYLRLVEGTPHVFDLYRRLFPKNSELTATLGLTHERISALILDEGLQGLWKRIRTDDQLVRSLKLEALRETLTLAYPSYILALAMGAGKTILIGAIVATEFAMAMEYPGADFVQNALVFAPGKTIIESLRELARIPYERLLPPRLHKRFEASVKLTFTRDGDKNVPVVPGSTFNIVVTNTEKIRIQKESVRKADLGGLLTGAAEDQAREEVANLRLQTIASLPHLAVFSDEAHHTYGHSLETGLKKVRKTVDYLAAQTKLICVVNTTGTPYYQRQPLKDVVIWYGLAEGIREDILKDVSGNIQAYDFSGDAAAYVVHIVKDFFHDYHDVRLPDGAPAKLAIYFPQTSDVKELRPVVDAALAEIGLSPAVVLVNTSDEELTKAGDIDAFNRLNDPAAPHRVILLVNKGTEGWNCPSLFACALARRLRTSNNFVLQAATRCLRQVPGNDTKARIYLSPENYGVLERQLKETYGAEIAELNRSVHETRRARIVLRRLDVPPLVVTQLVKTVVRGSFDADSELRLEPPDAPALGRALKVVYTLAPEETGSRVLRQSGDSVEIDAAVDDLDVYAAATELAGRYRLPVLPLVDRLRRLYGSGTVSVEHVEAIAEQIERQTRRYEVREEHVDRALALVKLDGFTKELTESGAEVYTAEILYAKEREKYLLKAEMLASGNEHHYGFHYSPLEFDSMPERDFFEQLLTELNVKAQDLEDFYFTGGLTDPAKTDFFVEYRDEKGRWRRYTPDFVIRKKAAPGRPPGSGRVYIVEIKREHDRAHPIDGEGGRKAMAVQRWEDLNPERIKYEMIFTAGDTVTYDQTRQVRRFAEERELYLPFALDRAQVEAFCGRWRVSELSLFGSVLQPRFGPESDVDFLATFAPGAEWSLLDLGTMEDELRTIVGREVDLVTRRAIEHSDNWIRRRSILETARPVYVEG